MLRLARTEILSNSNAERSHCRKLEDMKKNKTGLSDHTDGIYAYCTADVHRVYMHAEPMFKLVNTRRPYSTHLISAQ